MRFIMRAVSLSTCLLLWAVTLHGQAKSTGTTAKLAWGPATCERSAVM